MRRGRSAFRFAILVQSCLVATLFCSAARAQGVRSHAEDEEFGPVVRAYLGYLRNEQEVVDDRVSRREIKQSYYLRNTNRIRALRQMAIRIARESKNDYLPEFEAVTRDELGNLFETPPRPESLTAGAVLDNTFRFLGVVRSRELFYIFARLDPYEQAELIRKAQGANGQNASEQPASAGTGNAVHPSVSAATSEEPARTIPANHQVTTRPRRAGAP